MIINWWQMTIVGIVIFVVGFFLRQWTIGPPPIELHPIETVRGIPDTTLVAVQPIIGVDSSIVIALVEKNWRLQRNLNREIRTKKSLLSKIVEDSVKYELREIPMFEKVIDEYDADSTYILIRSRTYVLSDTSANVIVEWNIIPRPCETIERTDTSYVPKMVYIEVDPPFYEKPGFIAPVTAIGTYIIIKAVEFLFSK